ncbi:hypothetical protein IU501_22680 [Nocardia otitidiscaviarum]|uniref:hypothetical protein n=1 Tax=Nocardia otitidiscaviarum TaxID=1823 RepID=UPI0005B9CDDB|nr:hypothetical protein [Nocardia otitidiscaviarum]MBF6135801.1 hypothetical protein [Nocardia otitidiscaviarum]MBF6483614.1 hypothetical protein [Nocardia otitidiscaviarum]
MSTLDPTFHTDTEDAFARCRGYRAEHGLYGVVDPGLGRIMLEVGAVGAVTMPAELGHRVRARLRARCGPVIAHPRSARWTFLTGPTDNSYLDMTLVADLFRDCAGVALPGSRIVLPSPADERGGYRRWVCPPEGDFRPELAEVLDATRACRITHTDREGSA